MHERLARTAAWGGVAANFIVHNYSVVLSVACAFAALAASFYSIIVNRARLRILNIEEKIEKLAAERTRDIDFLRGELAGGEIGLGLNHKLRVLLVEDDPNDIHLIKRMLEPNVFIDSATTLKAAIEKTKESIYDCVLLDLTLPDSINRKTLETFLKEVPAATCIALSGSDDPGLIDLVTAQGADAYLHKNNINKEYALRMIKYAVLRNHAKKAHQLED